MLKLSIGNSYSRIEGLATKGFSDLKKELSYEVDPAQAYYRGGHRPRLKSLLDAKGHFPTGLLHRVEAWLAKQPEKYTTLDPRSPPLESARLKLSLRKIQPYHAQLQALNMAVTHSRGILSMPTGTGKSLVIALLLSTFQMKTLIVVPTLELKRQLSETLAEYFGPNYTWWVTVENIDSSNLNSLTDFDMLIIDEAHHVAANTYHKLNRKAWSNIYYRFFLTATPFRNQDHEQMLFEAIAGEVIFKLSYIDAIRAGYIVPVEAYRVDVPKMRVEGYTWQEVYSETVTKNTTRNEMIAEILTTLVEAGKPTLCLVKEVAHGKALSVLSGVPFVNGADEDSRQYIQQFNNGTIKGLIGTTGVIGEGIDTKPCEYVLIAGLGKAKSAFMQQVGRSVRVHNDKESAKIILFRDKSHKFCLKHYNEQAKILRDEYGVTVLPLTPQAKDE